MSPANPNLVEPGSVKRTFATAGPAFAAGAMTLSAFCKSVGLSRVTAWRYRRDGKLKTFNRFGRVFVTAKDAEEFFKTEGEVSYSFSPRTPGRPAA